VLVVEDDAHAYELISTALGLRRLSLRSRPPRRGGSPPCSANRARSPSRSISSSPAVDGWEVFEDAQSDAAPATSPW